MELTGKYTVMFKHPMDNGDVKNRSIETFTGKCENFTPVGKCVFSNDENVMVIVEYSDIVQMKPARK